MVFAEPRQGFVMGGWAGLLPELLASIARRINLYEDFVAFGGVCKSWRSAAVKDNFNQSTVQIPWLMLAEEENNKLRGFASLTKRGMVHRVALPEAKGKRCISSLGWLITTDEHGNTDLLHPLTLVRIALPHLSRFKYFEDEDDEVSLRLLIHRAVLSASPSVTQDYILMIIVGTGCYPAFWKPGNNIWTVIEPNPSVFCLDVIYYKDQFYAIEIGGNLLHCNPDSCSVLIVGRISTQATAVPDGETYLVESGGELLVVNRTRGLSDYDDRYWTRSFRVFKFDSKDWNKWQEVYDLGGTSIFVGQSAATAVVACGSLGIKRNCIYFTDDYEHQYATPEYPVGGNDIGFYNMKSGDIEPLVGMLDPKRSEPHNYYCPPLWVSPSF